MPATLIPDNTDMSSLFLDSAGPDFFSHYDPFLVKFFLVLKMSSHLPNPHLDSWVSVPLPLYGELYLCFVTPHSQHQPSSTSSKCVRTFRLHHLTLPLPLDQFSVQLLCWHRYDSVRASLAPQLPNWRCGHVRSVRGRSGHPHALLQGWSPYNKNPIMVLRFFGPFSDLSIWSQIDSIFDVLTTYKAFVKSVMLVRPRMT